MLIEDTSLIKLLAWDAACQVIDKSFAYCFLEIINNYGFYVSSLLQIFHLSSNSSTQLHIAASSIASFSMQSVVCQQDLKQ